MESKLETVKKHWKDLALAGAGGAIIVLSVMAAKNRKSVMDSLTGCGAIIALNWVNAEWPDLEVNKAFKEKYAPDDPSINFTLP